MHVENQSQLVLSADVSDGELNALQDSALQLIQHSIKC
jgi:hypothetical protein